MDCAYVEAIRSSDKNDKQAMGFLGGSFQRRNTSDLQKSR